MRPSERAWIAGIFIFAVALRGAFVVGLPYRPAPEDFSAYHLFGKTMAQTWTLGVQDKSGENISYRCFFPPGQVFTLGVCYRSAAAIDGFSNATGLTARRPDQIEQDGVLAAELLNVLLASASVVMVHLLGRRFFGTLIGRGASILAAVLPSTVFGCMVIGAEVPETFWLLLALCIYGRLADSAASGRPAAWASSPFRIYAFFVLCGVCLGIGALFRPTYLLLPIPIGLHMLLSWRTRGKALAAVMAITIGLAVVVAPWTYRNYLVTRSFMPVSSNGGGNLWSGNNECASDNWGTYTAWTWDWLFKNAPTDVDLHREGLARAKAWIAAHPGEFASLSLKKFCVLWYGDKDMAWWRSRNRATWPSAMPRTTSSRPMTNTPCPPIRLSGPWRPSIARLSSTSPWSSPRSLACSWPAKRSGTDPPGPSCRCSSSTSPSSTWSSNPRPSIITCSCR